MPKSTIHGVRIAGIAAVVPRVVRSIDDEIDLFEGNEAHLKRLKKTIGLGTRHVVPDGQCTSDLAQLAAQRLMAAVDWDRHSIDGFVMVTQSPDYFQPATACALHGKMGFPKDCATFDVNQGCTGYIYGLWIGAMMVSSGMCQRVLMLAGDTASRFVSPLDRSVGILFGDAGSATLLEQCEDSPPMHFALYTDGTGFDYLIIPAGGFRHPPSPETAVRTLRDDGNVRSDQDLYMNGAEIMNFSLRVVPPLIKEMLERTGWTVDDVDSFVLHQANRFIIRNVARKTKIPPHKCPDNIVEKYGNQSSASVPVTICENYSERLESDSMRVVMAGFGVGLSWGACATTLGPTTCLPIIVDESWGT